MTENDKALFKRMLEKLMSWTGQPKPTAEILETWFDFLKEFEAETIGHGIARFLDDPQACQFPPTPAKIRAFTKSLTLRPEIKLTPESIIAAAREPITPLGVLARIKIGSWDLNNGDSYYLRQRAHEVLQVLPDWQARASQGEYTKHEIEIMHKFHVDPEKPFSSGLPSPNRKALSNIAIKRAETGLESTKIKKIGIPTG